MVTFSFIYWQCLCSRKRSPQNSDFTFCSRKHRALQSDKCFAVIGQIPLTVEQKPEISSALPVPHTQFRHRNGNSLMPIMTTPEHRTCSSAKTVFAEEYSSCGWLGALQRDSEFSCAASGHIQSSTLTQISFLLGAGK